MGARLWLQPECKLDKLDGEMTTLTSQRWLTDLVRPATPEDGATATVPPNGQLDVDTSTVSVAFTVPPSHS